VAARASERRAASACGPVDDDGGDDGGADLAAGRATDRRDGCGLATEAGLVSDDVTAVINRTFPRGQTISGTGERNYPADATRGDL